MNTAELVVLLVVLLLIGNAVFFLWRNRRKRKCGCGYNCGGCDKCSAVNVTIDEGNDSEKE